MSIVVTGAAGRLGSVVTRHLAGIGLTVTGTDLVHRRDSAVPLTVANLLDRETSYALLRSAEGVVHLGNHPGPRNLDAQRVYSENTTMNINVLQAAAELGVRRVIFASTIQVIGSGPDLTRDGRCYHPYLPLDGHTPPRPGNLYALSKLATEGMLQYYARSCGMDCTAIRFPLLCGVPPGAEFPGGHTLYTTINEAFAALHLEDAARLIAALLRQPLTPGYRVYLPADPRPYSTVPLAELCARYYQHLPWRDLPGERPSLVDVAAITRAIGWVPQGWPAA